MPMKHELLDNQQNKITVTNDVTLKKRLSTILFFPALLAICFSVFYSKGMSPEPITFKDILLFTPIAAPFVFYVSYKMWKDLETKIILTNEIIIRKQPFSKDLHLSWRNIIKVTIGKVMKGNNQEKTRILLAFVGKKQSSLFNRNETIHCPSAGFFGKDNPLSRDAANLVLRNIDQYRIPIKGERELLEEMAGKPVESLQETPRPKAFGPENMEGVPDTGLFERQLLNLWIIWAGMFVFLIIYILICLLWGDSLQRTASPFPLDLMRDILYGVAVLTVILTHFLRNLILGGRSGRSEPMSSEPPSPPDQSSVVGKYVTAMIVSLALCESIGIYGFILFMLGGDLRTVFIFNGIAALAMFIYRPKREELKAMFIQRAVVGPR